MKDDLHSRPESKTFYHDHDTDEPLMVLLVGLASIHLAIDVSKVGDGCFLYIASEVAIFVTFCRQCGRGSSC